MKEKQGKIINIMLVDDHPIVRQGLKQIIEREDDLKISHEAESTEEAIKLLAGKNPDFAIVDISLNENVSGIELVKAIRDRYPGLPVLVLSMHDESLYAERSIRAGARGYIMKKEAPDNIIKAIRKVLNGDLYLGEKISSRIIDKLLHGSVDIVSTPVDNLSDRELEVFQLIGNGFGTREIARKLNLSVNTIESHRRHIKEKLKIDDSSKLIKHAVQWILTNR